MRIWAAKQGVIKMFTFEIAIGNVPVVFQVRFDSENFTY